MPYIVILRNYNKAVHDCFATAKISPYTKKDIKVLKQSIVDARLSETLKLHILMHHLEEGLDALNVEKEDPRGFLLWSKQAGESIHQQFLTHWTKYKMNLIQNISNPDRLKKAVIEFSSMHL